MSDLGEGVKATLMAKEEHLKEAIEEACAGIVRYNITQVRGTTEGRSAMGESTVPTAAEGGQVGSALTGYDEWVAAYLHDDHARKSDAAMKELQKQLADNTTMSAVLGLQEVRTGEQGGGLRTALQCAAEAIERERPDVAFLDIRMPGRNGLQVAQAAAASPHAPLWASLPQQPRTPCDRRSWRAAPRLRSATQSPNGHAQRRKAGE
jgi:CheY-like chemotaxis protein